VALDQVLLQVEGLDLAVGDDRLDPRHAGDELVDPDAVVAAACLEVLAHARAQGLCLPDVEHLVPLVAEQVDAGRRWHPS